MNTETAKNTTWITPKWLIDTLTLYSPFDLDPCAHTTMPWGTAKQMLTIKNNGLKCEWLGEVWLNPPYAKGEIDRWMELLAAHNNGVALVRTTHTAKWWKNSVLPYARCILYLYKRIHFCNEKGIPAKANAGADICLVAFGHASRERLREANEHSCLGDLRHLR